VGTRRPGVSAGFRLVVPQGRAELESASSRTKNRSRSSRDGAPTKRPNAAASASDRNSAGPYPTAGSAGELLAPGLGSAGVSWSTGTVPFCSRCGPTLGVEDFKISWVWGTFRGRGDNSFPWD
jgi:hypothetical protein